MITGQQSAPHAPVKDKCPDVVAKIILRQRLTPDDYGKLLQAMSDYKRELGSYIAHCTTLEVEIKRLQAENEFLIEQIAGEDV